MQIAFQDFSTFVGRAVPMPSAVIVFEGVEVLPLLGLLDTGSLQDLASEEVAQAVGVDLSHARVERRGIGGDRREVRFATVGLRLGPHAWEAPVGFQTS